MKGENMQRIGGKSSNRHNFQWTLPAWIALFALLIAPKSRARADDAQGLRDGDLLAICGDSITEQKIYSNFIEDYLLMCKPVPNVRAEQFGWGGETSWGFRDKMDRFTLPFKPTAATTCYGMNDGGYNALTPDRRKMYTDAQRTIIQKFKEAGVHYIVLGSPGAVDSDSFHNNPADAVIYNQTLNELKEIDQKIAQEEGVTFADVHDTMIAAMAQAKAKYGHSYHVCGPDGVHPNPNGHIVMAYAFLKAMGFDGNIGTITFDLASNAATATDGHKIVSGAGGKIDVESSRYPFCFWGDPSSEDSTTGMIEFIPFNQDLNRFTLVVKNAGSDRVKVTWGNTAKEFSAADLEKGINLAAEFLDNPFVAPFRAEHDRIHAKEEWETKAIKNFYFIMPSMQTDLPGLDASFNAISAGIEKRVDEQSRAVAENVPPVKYSILIEAVK
jgi:lysophospholipase L1-like esterase